jgi:transposase InsO family protein
MQEEIIRTETIKEANNNRLAHELLTIENQIMVLVMKEDRTEEEDVNLVKLEKRLGELERLQARLKNKFENMAMAAVAPTFETELKKKAAEENVLKGILTRKPRNLDFISTRDDPLAFIERFGQFVTRECKGPLLIEHLMLPLLNACTKDDPTVNMAIDQDRPHYDALRPKVMLLLNGDPRGPFHIDTCSDLTLVVEDEVKAIFGEIKWTDQLEQHGEEIQSASATCIPVIGKINLKVQTDESGPTFDHEFVVVRKLPGRIRALIGNDLQAKLGFKVIHEPTQRVVNNEFIWQGSKRLKTTAEGFRVTETPDGVHRGQLVTNSTLVKGSAAIKSRAEGANRSTEEPGVIDPSEGVQHGQERIGPDSTHKKMKNYIDPLAMERKRLFESIEEQLEINSKLTGFCTYPDAEIRFETIDDDPVVVSQYPIAIIHHETVEKQIADWRKDGVIAEEKSLHHYNNPLLVVPKPDIRGNVKGWRTCVDPRMINRKIKESTHRLPKIEMIFQRLAGKRYFTIIDLKSGFNQIKIYEPHRLKTAFTWNQRVYHFVGAPFGFKNIPQDFQRIMDRIFRDMDFVIPYIDDLIIFSDSIESHTQHVTLVLQQLNKYNLRANLEKLQLLYEAIIILGHEISQEGIRVVQEKLERMDFWQPPRNVKMLQRYLGFINYFRNFIPNYAKVMGPIEDLRRGKQKNQNERIEWKPEHAEIFSRVRAILESRVLLKYPDFDKPLYVGTDASQYGLGAVLYQEGPDGAKQYVKFASRSLVGSEKHYGAPQRELLGVLFALTKFHDYIYGRKFKLYTDHQSLTYLLSKPKLAHSLQNWLGEILEYDFEIIHLPGLSNHLPDALSRLCEEDKSQDKPLVLAIVENGELTVLPSAVNSQIEPGVYNETLDSLETEADLDVRRDLMTRAHAGLHEGAAGMARAIRTNFKVTWPGLEKDCQEYVQRCIACQRYNVGRHGYQPPKSIVAIYPFDHLCIDLKEMPMSDSGNEYYLWVIDVATRFLFLRALKDKAALTVAQALYQIFCDVGFPKMIQSDNGTEFVNEVMAGVKSLASIEERLIAPYSHKSNGMAERAIGTTSKAIWKAVQGRVTNWDKMLPAVQYLFNNRVLEIHGSTPYSLIYARRANDFFDFSRLDLTPEEKGDRENRLHFLNAVVFPEIKEKVKKNLKIRNERFVRTHRIHKSDYPDGAYVMVKADEKAPKYRARYDGPLMVIGREASGGYRLKGPDGTEYVRSPDLLKLAVPELVSNLDVRDTIYAAVSKIVDHKELPNGKKLYRVRWQKQSATQDSWLKEEDFQDLGPLQDYNRNLVKESKPMEAFLQPPPRTPKLPVRTVDDPTTAVPERIIGVPIPRQPERDMDQTVLLSEEQKRAWGPKQFKLNAKRVHRPAIVESDSDID